MIVWRIKKFVLKYKVNFALLEMEVKPTYIFVYLYLPMKFVNRLN